MPLNIKDDFVHQQAKKIAALTGESLTQVVRSALADRLQNVQRQQRAKAAKSVEGLMALAKVVADNSAPGSNSAQHSELYDDNGLPK